MRGREGLVKTSLFATLALISVALPAGHWLIQNRNAMATLWNAFPWIAAVMVCVKTAAAVWIAGRLHSRGLMRRRTLPLGGIAWGPLRPAVPPLLAWIVPTLLFRAYFLVLVAMLAVPLARLV